MHGALRGREGGRSEGLSRRDAEQFAARHRGHSRLELHRQAVVGPDSMLNARISEASALVRKMGRKGKDAQAEAILADFEM